MLKTFFYSTHFLRLHLIQTKYFTQIKWRLFKILITVNLIFHENSLIKFYIKIVMHFTQFELH